MAQQKVGIVEVDKSLDTFIRDKVEQIKTLHHQTLENVVEMGRLLIQLKNAVDHGQYLQVVKEELGMTKQTSLNYVNLAHIWDNYPDYREGISNLALNSAYLIAKKSYNSEIREAVLSLSEQGDPPKLEEIREVDRIVEEYRQYKIGEYEEIDDEAKVLLYDTALAEDGDQLRRLSNLSRRAQKIVAKIISNGEADNCRDALRIHQERNREESQSKQEEEKRKNSQEPKEKDQKSNTLNINSKVFEDSQESEGSETVEVSYSEPTFNYTYLGSNWRDLNLEAESLDLMLVEAPMKHQFLIDGGFKDIFDLGDHYLKEGGFLITTIGHKTAMFIGEEAPPLEPLHLLTVRRQPGRTRSIVGINIACASVMLALLYKPNFKAPKSMLADLQTIDENPDNVEVETGIEKGLNRFLETLLEPNSDFLHMVCSSQEQFKVRDSIIEKAKELKISNMYAIG